MYEICSHECPVIEKQNGAVGIFFSETDSCFDVIMFTETWSRTDTDAFSQFAYRTYFINRDNKRAGGVSLLVKYQNCELVDDFNVITDDYEILTVKYESYLYSAMYRPPGSSLTNFCSFLERYFAFVLQNRITQLSSSLLDVFITNCEVSAICSCVISFDISDHLPICISYAGLSRPQKVIANSSC